MSLQSTSFTPAGNCPLESVLFTDEFHRRATRPPDYEAECTALHALAQALADSPRTILQTLVETAVEVCDAGSGGVSLLNEEDGGQTFYWPAVAGAWTPHIGSGTPRDFSPCGVVLDRDAVQLFAHLERYYPYFADVLPSVSEALLTPVHIGGRPVGTVWVVAHDEGRKFDAEDERLLVSLGRFASFACQAWTGADAREKQARELRQVDEALRETDRHRNDFLATLAHELRNPIAPLRNGLQLIALAQGNAGLVEQARVLMERQLGQMVRLVDDLMDMIRISRGKLELRKGHVALATVVNHAVETSRPLIDDGGHELTVTQPSEAIFVDADVTRLGQVFTNLLNNAAKYTERGGHIRLAVEREDEAAVVHIKDSGVGIPLAMQATVFDLFTQIDRSLERSQGGLGIGLAVVKRLVEGHGGSIEVRSEGLGLGSEFVVRLPIVSPAVDGTEPHLSGEQAVSFTPRRILVADDNVDSAICLKMVLECLGHDVQTANDGLRAVHVAETFRPDVILMDLAMPKLNGYEACRLLRRESWGRGALIIALTGLGQDEDKRRSEEVGFNHHMVKPLDPDELQKLLAAVPN